MQSVNLVTSDQESTNTFQSVASKQSCSMSTQALSHWFLYGRYDGVVQSRASRHYRYTVSEGGYIITQPLPPASRALLFLLCFLFLSCTTNRNVLPICPPNRSTIHLELFLQSLRTVSAEMRKQYSLSRDCQAGFETKTWPRVSF